MHIRYGQALAHCIHDIPCLVDAKKCATSEDMQLRRHVSFCVLDASARPSSRRRKQTYELHGQVFTCISFCRGLVRLLRLQQSYSWHAPRWQGKYLPMLTSLDSEGIRAPAGRAQWISSPSP